MRHGTLPMAASGPCAAATRNVAIQLSRPRAASRPALADPAGHRPRVVIHDFASRRTS